MLSIVEEFFKRDPRESEAVKEDMETSNNVEGVKMAVPIVLSTGTPMFTEFGDGILQVPTRVLFANDTPNRTALTGGIEKALNESVVNISTLEYRI